MKKLSYKQMRERLELLLRELETAETSDIDKTILLHDKALLLVDKLEAALTQKTKAVKKHKV